MIVLISGTSKGLGLALARHYLSCDDTVIGVSRHHPDIDHPRYHHCRVDLTDDASKAALTDFLATLAIPRVDILINNAGTGGQGSHLLDVDPQALLSLIDLHCVGVLRLTQAAQHLLHSSKIVNITSRLGSVKQNERGDFVGRKVSYSYRIAKSAQNMLSLCMRDDPVLASSMVISLNPGLLMTDSGSEDASHTAEEGATACVRTINTAQQSGIYHAFDEEAIY